MNTTRAQRLTEMLMREGEGYHALVCRLPQNVLMLTGYLPILGNSLPSELACGELSAIVLLKGFPERKERDTSCY